MNSNYPPGVTGYERIFQEAEEHEYCSECGELADDIKDGLCRPCTDGPCTFMLATPGIVPQACGRRGEKISAGILCVEHQRKLGLDAVSLQRAAEREIESRRYRRGRAR
jgi:hypothetical protein